MICLGCKIIRKPPINLGNLPKPDFNLDWLKRLQRPDLQAALLDICYQEVQNLRTQHKSELDQLANSLKKWTAPFEQEMQDFLLGLKGKKGDEAIEYTLSKLLEYLDTLDLEALELTLNELFDEALATLTDFLNTLYDDVIEPAIDDLIEWLQSDWKDYLEDTNANDIVSDAFNRFLLAKDVEQFKEKLKTRAADIPTLTKENYLDPILVFIRTGILTNNIETVREHARDGRDLIDKLLELQKAVAPDASKPGKGPGQYLWYASWLTKSDIWNIDGKICRGPLFTLAADEDIQSAADQVSPSAKIRFSEKGFSLGTTQTIQVEIANEKWIIIDTDTEQQFFLRRSGILQKIQVFELYPQTDWRQLPSLSSYTYKVVEPELAEAWAYHSSWLSNILNALLHLSSMEPTTKTGAQSDAISNFGNSLIHFTYAGLKLRGPAGYYHTTHDLNLEAYWTKSAIPNVATLFASLEGRQRAGAEAARFNHWVYQAGLDFSEKRLYDYWIRRLRDGLLAYLTLLNYQGQVEEPPSGSADTRPGNRRQIPEFSLLFAELATWVTVAVYPKEHYGFPQGSNPDQAGIFLLHWFGMGTLTGMASMIAGLVAAESLAQAKDTKQWCRSIKNGLGAVWAKFPQYLYLAHEGATGYGRLNPEGAPMPGYADPDTSPYSLPYPFPDPGGPYEDYPGVYQCVQGNLGMWGHNSAGSIPELYAYDFGLDFGHPVVAARSGIVWAYSNDPDTDPERGCFIQLLHEAPVANSEHDVGPDKKAVRTFAEYRHGDANSVLSALGTNIKMEAANVLAGDNQVSTEFKNAGVDLAKLGTTPVAVLLVNGAPKGPAPVQQGDLIMRAGHSGKAAFSHLHFQVHPAKYDSDNNIIGLESYTIPVVFKDVKAGFWTRAGVPRSGHFYQKENN